MHEWFEKQKKLGIGAEHGYFYRYDSNLKTKDDWNILPITLDSIKAGASKSTTGRRLTSVSIKRQQDEQDNFLWKDLVRQIFKDYCERADGSFIEEK